MIPKLSVIIPIYNAESFILETIKRIKNWQIEVNFSVEILLVNDGSKDSTWEIISNNVEPNDSSFKLIDLNKNVGKGNAVKTGMLAANGEFRVFTDADIPYGFEIFKKIIYYLNFKEFDVCIGNRKSKYSTYYAKLNFMRKLSSNIFTTIISRYVVTGVNDTQCGLKGFTAASANTLFGKSLVNGFAFDVEILYLSYKLEYDIKRIPVSFEGNDESTINLASNSVNMLWEIFRLPFNYHFFKKY